MVAHDDKLLIYFEHEEDIVRQLGAAAISCWPQLPEAVQAMLIERSSKVFANEETPEFEQRFKEFIALHASHV
jgi:hypothetical protein